MGALELSLLIHKLRWGNKALSPIFATLIILAVVTVLFIPVFIWATNITSQTNDSSTQSGMTTTERIVLEEISMLSGSPNCIAYVRNIGATSVTINDVIISLPTGSLHVYQGGQLAISPSSVVQGDLISIAFNLGFAPAQGDVYTVSVYTKRGVGDSLQVVT